MRAPDFWRADGIVPRLLAPLGILYGAVAARRLRRKAPRAALPTIVVGGVTAGGDGKTPLAIALADILAGTGETPAVLTRGYGRPTIFEMSAKCLPFTGRSTVEDRRVGSALTGFDEPSPHPTPLRGATLPVKGRDERVSSIDELNAYSADAVGDEALLLARHAMTIVGADRVAGAKLAQEKGATVLILDDGLQSRRLMPDLALLAIDSNYGAGNERCIPAGPLRAPLDAQLAAADALVVIGDGAAGKAIAARTAKPVFQAQIVPDVQIARELEGVRVVAFAGIGRPEKFFQTLRNIGAEVIETRAFPDHHRFGDADIADLKRLRSRCGARLVTTSKDAMRLRGSGLEVCALPISLALTNMDGLAATLGQAIERARAVRAS